MEQQISRFVIAREDRSFDPVTVVSEGLALGRAPDCELHLNHPTVSRLHAGIQLRGGRFYLYHFSKSNATTLNGLLVEDRAPLSEGDVIQVGPFTVTVSFRDRALRAEVRYQTAVRVGDGAVGGEQATVAVADPAGPADAGAADAPGLSRSSEIVRESFAADVDLTETAEGGERADAFELFWGKRKREAGKIAAASPLRPHAPPRLGKMRYNWRPTRDLVRPWPPSLFIWAAVVVGLLSAAAAFGYTAAFSPAPVSDAHARPAQTAANADAAIARAANAGSCTTCHSLARSMEQACASCHQTGAFSPATLDAHAAAGVGCVACHAEHRGRNFRPGVAPLAADFQPGVAADETCAGCHNDANPKLYNGRRVGTPHGGTVGYPVEAGRWTWEGLGESAWKAKPEGVRRLLSEWPAADEQARRNQQFHALHLHRVRAAEGMPANGAGELSCSSCHASLGAALDRDTPRRTCAACHNGLTDAATGRPIVAADAPNCTSCHAQHPRVRRDWAGPLLAGR